jgi:phage FluMu protein Com
MYGQDNWKAAYHDIDVLGILTLKSLSVLKACTKYNVMTKGLRVVHVGGLCRTCKTLNQIYISMLTTMENVTFSSGNDEGQVFAVMELARRGWEGFGGVCSR